jgi:hypothetical protein
MAAPDFRDPLQGGCHQGKSLVQFETGSAEERMPIISQSTTDSKTLFPRNGGFVIMLLLHFSLNWTNATNLLFQFFLGMTIRLDLDPFSQSLLA